MLKPEQSIGIFDSGVGGLTVASAIKHVLPDERIIYFGDTAHLPYGDKSNETIINYSTQITDFLLEKNVKLVLIACNTASAVAYNKLVSHLNNSVFLLNVIDPVVNYIIGRFSGKKVGVIGTKATIKSGTYEHKIMEKDDRIEVSSLATPLFVPMIEEGFVYDDISNAIIRAYLSDKRLENIQSLILGCTHYPIIKNQIRRFFDFNVEVVDSSNIVALHLKELLEKHNLLNNRKYPEDVFYVSDYTEYFESIARMFFDESIHLEKKNIWKE
ncbi:MAG: glutamate racemase [Bacteroidales bacterium]|nr:glutamate racemase [Bacteroidales bacterium]